MERFTALILGATGATGKELLLQLLEDPDFERVKIFTRKPVDLKHPKLEPHTVDFDHPETWNHLLTGDILFSALGTTLKQAGSKPAQYKVDYTYALEAAQTAAEHGVRVLTHVSAYGADKNAWVFYSRMKGELEQSLLKLPFKTLHIFRPGLLDRSPDRERPMERITLKLILALNAVGILKRHRPMPVKVLAKQMIRVSKNRNAPGVNYYNLNQIFNLSPT